MNEERQIHLTDWAFRLLIIVLTVLWLVFPPESAEVPAPARTGAVAMAGGQPIPNLGIVRGQAR